MMRAIIVDDEMYAREELECMLNETGEFIVVGKYANAVEAIRAIQKERPEVLFLDIQMPAINGFELLSMIDENIMPHVIFVTAHDEYALRAFEEHGVDYLLKPIEKSRLAKTVQKLKRMSNTREKMRYGGQDITRIPCILSSKIKLVNVSEIEYVKSTVAGVYVVCPAGEFFTELSLKIIEDKTPLFRCHKQFLINLDHVDEIVLPGNMLAVVKTKTGKTVPVSRRHLKTLRERFNF